ncbi:hypothetical protein ACIOJ4_49325, partial [Streptomyces chartreusis]
RTDRRIRTNLANRNGHPAHISVNTDQMLSKRFEDGFVVEWGPRIPLPALVMDGIEPTNDDGPGEIDIPVDFR